jgi:hypothetical protein
LTTAVRHGILNLSLNTARRKKTDTMPTIAEKKAAVIRWNAANIEGANLKAALNEARAAYTQACAEYLTIAPATRDFKRGEFDTPEFTAYCEACDDASDKVGKYEKMMAVTAAELALIAWLEKAMRADHAAKFAQIAIVFDKVKTNLSARAKVLEMAERFQYGK